MEVPPIEPVPPPRSEVLVRQFGASRSRISSLLEWQTNVSAAVG